MSLTGSVFVFFSLYNSLLSNHLVKQYKITINNVIILKLIYYICQVENNILFLMLHISESVFALSDYENVAIFFNQRTTIKSLRSTLVMMLGAFVLPIFILVGCEVSVVYSGKVATPS